MKNNSFFVRSITQQQQQQTNQSTNRQTRMSTRYTPASLFAIIAIATILFISTCTAAFEFDLDARSYKCFREELPTNFDVYGEIEAFHGYGQTIDFRVHTFFFFILISSSKVSIQQIVT